MNHGGFVLPGVTGWPSRQNVDIFLFFAEITPTDSRDERGLALTGRVSHFAVERVSTRACVNTAKLYTVVQFRILTIMQCQ